jgi:hypothetical protein
MSGRIRFLCGAAGCRDHRRLARLPQFVPSGPGRACTTRSAPGPLREVGMPARVLAKGWPVTRRQDAGRGKPVARLVRRAAASAGGYSVTRKKQRWYWAGVARAGALSRPAAPLRALDLVEIGVPKVANNSAIIVLTPGLL